MVLARQPGRKRVQGIGPSAQQAKRMAGGGITDGQGLAQAAARAGDKHRHLIRLRARLTDYLFPLDHL